jgi:hypothetical protein
MSAMVTVIALRAGSRRRTRAALTLVLSLGFAGGAQGDMDGGGFARIVVPTSGATRVEGGANLRIEERAWDHGHPVTGAPAACGPLAADPESLCLRFRKWDATAGNAGSETGDPDFAAIADRIAAESDPVKVKRASEYLAEAQASWDIGLHQSAQDQLRNAAMTLYRAYGRPAPRE